MNHREQIAGTPLTGQGPSVSLRALAALLLAALAGAVLLAAPSASADGRIGGSNRAPDYFLPGGISGVSGGLAVSESEGGSIYLLDTLRNQRVDQFQPGGAFVRAFGWGIVPGAAAGTGDLTAGSTAVTNVTTSLGSFATGFSSGQGKILTAAGGGIPSGDQITAVQPAAILLAEPATVSEAGVPISVQEGPGNVPTNEVQEVAVSATAGQFTLGFRSPEPGSTLKTTAPIDFNAPATGAGGVQEALEALPNIGSGNVSVSGGPGDETGEHPYRIEFTGRYADTNVHRLAPTNQGLSGGSPATAVVVTKGIEGGGALETCTTACMGASMEEGSVENGTIPSGLEPGRMTSADEIAIDNDPASESHGDVYVVDQHNFRVEKYDREGHFLLMFGGQVDKTKVEEGRPPAEQDLCTEADLEAGDECGAGVPGSEPGFFEEVTPVQRWSGSNNNHGSNSIAVGPGGTVYVGDYRRVQKFESDGSYAGVLTLPGQQFVTSLAVDSEGHAYALSPALNEIQQVVPPASGTFTLGFEGHTTGAIPYNATEGQIQAALEGLPTIGSGNVRASGNCQIPHASLGQCFEFTGSLGHADVPLLTASGASVETFEQGAPGELARLGPTGEVLQTFDTEAGADPTHIALDASGNLFISEAAGNPTTRFRAYKPDGTLFAEFSSDQVSSLARGIAIGASAAKLYVATEQPEGAHIAVRALPVAGPPTVGAERVTDLRPKTATLHAVVNPEQFDTRYRFEWITEAAFNANPPGEEFNGAEHSAFVDLGSVSREDSVQTAISELNPATTYRWRVLAENSQSPSGGTPGTAEALETLPAVSIRDLTTQTVGPELVTFKAELNNNNSIIAGHYVLRYGADEHYECEVGNTCLAEGNLPAGSGEFTKLENRGREDITFTGLRPDTTYHYQLTAENQYGEIKTDDATFTTELSAAEERTAEDCPVNGTVHGAVESTLREENHSLALPDCRAYEQVSPEEKNASEALIPQLAAAAEDVAFASPGAFAGAGVDEAFSNYVAHRTPAGWLTQPALASSLAAPDVQPVGYGLGLSTEYYGSALDRWLFVELPGRNSEEARSAVTAGHLSIGFADGSYALHASPTLSLLEGRARVLYRFAGPIGAADDLSRVFILTPSRLLPAPEDPRPDAGSGPSNRIYEIAGTTGPDPTISLVAEVPLGLPEPQIGSFGTGCEIDHELSLVHHPRTTSADGAALLYIAPLERAAGAHCGEETPNPFALFARLNGGPPVQVNAPLPSQCAPSSPCHAAAQTAPVFYGVSPDGTRAWFTTTQPLIDSDTDQTADLYLARFENGQLAGLVQVSAGEASSSHPHVGKGADVKGVVEISPDGSHVAFVATGVLTEGENALHQSAVPGADNLYVYDANSGETKFVTRLCSAPEESGSLSDPACPASLSSTDQAKSDHQLWFGSGNTSLDKAPAYFTPDGRYLLFASYGRLSADDTDGQSSAYRYDFSTGQLIRVSIGHRGNDGNGNDDAFPVQLGTYTGTESPAVVAEDGRRSISADGSIVIFATRAPLVSRDTNNAPDIYEWEEAGHGTCAEPGGCISLVSDGVDPHGADSGVINASGADIVFRTRHSFSPADTDGVADIYDAREGGGFAPPPPPPPCTPQGPGGSAEVCHGSPTSESVQVNPVSEATKHGSEGETGLHCAKGRHKVKKHGQVRCVPNKHHHHHRRAARRARASSNRGGVR